MNAFTLPSVAIGALLLVLLALSLLAVPEPQGDRPRRPHGGSGAGFSLPSPGFPLYFAYRSYWKRARLMRAQRDVIRLPLRYFPPSADGNRGKRATLLPDMEPYLMVRGMMDGAHAEVIVSEGTSDHPAARHPQARGGPSPAETRQGGRLAAGMCGVCRLP